MSDLSQTLGETADVRAALVQRARGRDHLIDQLWDLVASWESPNIHAEHQSGCRIAAAQLREVLEGP